MKPADHGDLGSGSTHKGFSVILACTQDSGIGLEGSLPWTIKRDMEYFRTITSTTSDPAKQNAVIMGRLTWESIPAKFRPLKGRANVILTTNQSYRTEKGIADSVLIFQNFEQALEGLSRCETVERIFVCGGARLYDEAILSEHCQKIYVTKVLGEWDTDVKLTPTSEVETKFEIIPQESSEVLTEGDVDFQFVVLKRKRSETPQNPTITEEGA